MAPQKPADSAHGLKADVDAKVTTTEVKADEKPVDKKPEFIPSHGLTSAEAEEALKVHGKNALEEKVKPKWLIFLEQLWGPMPIMIWIAVVVEIAIGGYIDMAILLLLQFTNAFVSWYEATKAGDAVAALKAALKPKATVKRDGKWQEMDGTLVVPGDLVLLAAGSAVPADAYVNDGRIEVDQSAMTGESLPVTMRRGDSAVMGSTVVRGEVEGTVYATGKNTELGKTASMIQAVEGMGHFQLILLRIMGVLVVLSLLLCGICMVYLLCNHEKFKKALSFTVVLLVASIPIAMEVVCTTTLALGSRQLSAMDAIVTRLTSIEELAGMNMLCSDKTGTLTLNKMVIQEDCPIFVPGVTKEDVIRFAALAAKWKEPPRDALDTLVLGTADLPSLDVYEQIDFMPFDPTVKRTAGTLKGPDGNIFKTTKGAPHIILELCTNKEGIRNVFHAKVNELGERGIRCLAVAKSDGNNDEFKMCGLLTFLDPPRPDTKITIERAMEYGVDVKMITGDHAVIARETARTLGMGTHILGAEGLPTMPKDGKIPKDLGVKYGKLILDSDGFAQVYPEHKYLIVEALRQEGFAVGMTGDGVNDAPALKRADIGIAVSGATDAARAAADIVLTQPGLSVIVEAILISRQIFQRMKTFINYRIACTLQLLVFFFIAVLSFKPTDYCPTDANGQCIGDWPSFFHLPVIMLILITLLNDGTLITIAYDNVRASPLPQKWNLKAVFVVSIVLGMVACAGSILLLYAALDSWNPNGIFHAFGLRPINYDQIVTMIYLKVSISDFLTLFSARCQSWFWTERPGKLLFCGGVFALTMSTVLACAWPQSHMDELDVLGLARGHGTYKLWAIWVWLYCLVWWIIQDAAKVFTYWLLFKYDLFGVRSQAHVNVREAMTANDPKHPLARQSVGVVQGKVLNRKVDNAIETVERIARKSGEPGLARVSAGLNLVRQSAAANAATLAKVEEADVETQVFSAQQAMQQVHDAAQALPAEQRLEVEVQLAQVDAAAQNLHRASQALSS